MDNEEREIKPGPFVGFTEKKARQLFKAQMGKAKDYEVVPPGFPRARAGYQYGGRYKPEGGVTPIDERKDIQAAEDMRQTSVANMHKHVTSGGRRPSGVSARNTSGVLGSYTGAGAGSAVAKSLQNIGDDIGRGVLGAAKHFPGYHSAIGGLAKSHLGVTRDFTNMWRKGVNMQEYYNYLDEGKALTRKAGDFLEKHLGWDKFQDWVDPSRTKGLTDLGILESGENPAHFSEDRGMGKADYKARREIGKESAEKFGREAVESGIKRGVGKALGYATGVGVAVDIGLAAKWAWDYNKDNPGAVAGHKEALYRNQLKAGSPGKWGVDI
jgi:hypothetical protein